MSGRTFGVQSSWDEVLRKLTAGLDISGDQLRQSVSIAESMNQQLEEFINRYVVTASNDNGDLTFDAAGAYTFEGNLVVNGTSDLNGVVTIAGDTTITGTTVVTGTLNVPDITTAASWHVDALGLMWAGSNVANKATAPFKVTASGAVTADNITLTSGGGGITLAGILNVGSTGYISLGASTDGPGYLVEGATDFGSGITVDSAMVWPEQDGNGATVGTLGGITWRYADSGLTAGESSGELYLSSGKTSAPSAPDEGDEASIKLWSASNGSNAAGESKIDYSATHSHHFLLADVHVDGNVGIGTTSPGTLLHLATTATASTELLRLTGAWTGTSGQGYIVGETSADGGVLSAIGLGIGANAANANDGGIEFLTTSAATTSISGLTSRMVIDHVGNVGIGTTSPGTPLTIVSSGSAQLRLQNTTSTTAGPYIQFYHSTGRIGFMGFPNNDDLYLKNESTAGLIYMSTNNTTRFRILANGQMSGQSGTAALPAYTFTSGGNNEGMFYLASVTAIAAGGTTAMQVASNRTYLQATGTAAGTAARLYTVTVNGVSMKGLYFDSSFGHLKSGVQEWGLTDEQFMAIETPSYLVNGDFVTADGVHSAPSIEGDDEGGWTTLPAPEGAQLLRRAGFMYENLAEVDLHLVTDNAPDEKAMAAAIVDKVKSLMSRVERLETQALR